MKKKAFALCLVLVTVIGTRSLFAETLLWKGTRELGISGYLGDNGEDTIVTLSGRFGYFVADDVELGLFAGGGSFANDQQQFSGGVFGERNFSAGSIFVPHFGGSIGYAWRDTGWETDQYAEFSAWVGARVFFIEYAAIGLQAVGFVATDDIYNGNQDMMDWEMRLITSWYF